MKRLVKIVAAVVVLLIVALVALPFLINPNQFRPLLEAKLAEALGRTVKVGDLKLALMEGSVTAGDVSISEDPAFGTEPFLKAQGLHAAVELRPLIFDRKLNITSVTIDRPDVRIAMNGQGEWNFSTIAKSGQAPAQTPAPAEQGGGMDLSIRQVNIADGRITFARPGTKPQVFNDIDVELRNIAANSPIDFTLTGKPAGSGTVQLEGKAGPLGGSAALPPLEAKFTVPSLDLNASGLVAPSTGVAGVAALNGGVKTAGNAINLTGNVRAENLKLVAHGRPATRPVELTFAVSHDVVRRSGRLQTAKVEVGKAISNLNGTYSLSGEEPSFALKFAGDKMPLTDLAAMLPSLDITLPSGATIEGGTLSIQSNVTGSLGSFSAIGPVKMENARIANFDLGTKLRVIQLLAGIPATPVTEIETLSAVVKRTPNGTLIDDLNMVVSKIGTLSGSGTIDANNALDFTMRTTLHTSGELVRALGQKGDTTIPFLIAGTASNPVFRPDVKSLAKEKVQQLTKDPSKSIEAAKDIFNLFRKPKEQTKEPPQQ